MNVEQFCKSVIDRVYTSTRHDCTDTQKTEIYARLADDFSEKAAELDSDRVPSPAPTTLTEGVSDNAPPATELDERVERVFTGDAPESESEACAVEADRDMAPTADPGPSADDGVAPTESDAS